jgi:hypothetical protein
MSEPGKNLPVPQAPEAKAKDAKAKKDAKAERAARRAKASKAEKAKKTEKAARQPVGFARLFGWFIVGIAVTVAAAIAALLWGAWSEPAYVVSPQLNALASDFGGYALGALVFCLALVVAMLFRGAAGWLGFALLTVVAAILIGGQALMLSMGITSCERERVLEAASPDRRLVVIALKGACRGAEEMSYRVKVRELGPLVPREVTIFESFAKPVPAEIAFANGAITIVAKPEDDGAPPAHYPVTLDRRSMKPGKVWRLSEGRAADGS